MPKAPLNVYSYEYQLDGKKYAFSIIAESKEESTARCHAMAEARLIGRISGQEPVGAASI